MNQWRAVVVNENHAPVFTAARRRQEDAVEICATWILGHTDEKRKAIGIADSDEGWLATLMDNGFYTIEVWEE